MAAICLSKVVAGNLIQPLDLEIPDAAFAVVTGPPGAGKSSLVRAIAGLEEILSGEIRIGDKIVNDLAPQDRDVAMVFANDTLFPQMTVRENIGFGLRQRRFGATEIKKRVEEIAAALSLTDWLGRKPEALPLAERRCVALARAVVRQPKVLLFDHALSSLDRDTREKFARQISALHERLRATTVFVTTDVSEAMNLAEVIAILHEGVLQAFGPPRSLYEQPANMRVAEFLGRPPMNFFPGALKRDRGSVRFQEANSGTIEFALPKADRLNVDADKIVLGVRPEDIELARAQSGQTSRASANFRAISESILPFGNGTDIYFHTGAHSGTCRSQEWVDSGEAGQRLEFIINLEKVHFFDKSSGKRIV